VNFPAFLSVLVLLCHGVRVGFGPKLDPTAWGEPLRWHKLFGHSFRFPKAFLHLLAGEGVWGRGRHLSSFPQ
jgi:hypothetical protein